MRTWIGLALLSAAWLFGTHIYYAESWPMWAGMIALGTLLLVGVQVPVPSLRASVVAFVMLLPALWIAPWPYKTAVLVLLAGILLSGPGIRQGVARWLGGACLLSGAVLVAQGLALHCYEVFTAPDHTLPALAIHALERVGGLLRLDIAASGQYLAVHSMRKTHLISATWGLLLDPATLALLVGAVVAGVMLNWPWLRNGARARRIGQVAGAVMLLLGVWLPVRVGLMLGIYTQRVLRTEYDEPLNVVSQFWNPWILSALLIVPVVLLWRLVPLAGWMQRQTSDEEATLDEHRVGPTSPLRRGLVVGMAAVAVALVVAGITWFPNGERKAGRILVDEAHGDWEPTYRPDHQGGDEQHREFDTTWYGHDSGYNYTCIYDYLSRFYEMGRLRESITDATLANCDVLWIKTPGSSDPNRRFEGNYTADEVAAIKKFVNAGGGLLLIGEHTNVFYTGNHINTVARAFGLEFRYDCAFGIDAIFEQHTAPPFIPHPVAQHMPYLDWAVSCTIKPTGGGRSVLRGTGLKQLGPDYHASNYYPQARDEPEMTYGAFEQFWSVRHGAGRVLAFGDSTQFSNFSTFEPGKAELMLGMMEWLNHKNARLEPGFLLIAAGLLLAVAGRMIGSGWRGAWLPMLAAGLLGWVISATAVAGHHQKHMPLPTAVRPMTKVVIDRTLCSTTLAKGGFIGGKSDGFGIFERWILRLGWFHRRLENIEELQSDDALMVMFYPTGEVKPRIAERIRKYLEGGGHLLVIDSSENRESTANQLLAPYKMSLMAANLGGQLENVHDWPSVPVQNASIVEGGTTLASVDGKPVLARTRVGEGSIIVVGFGSRFADLNMGVTGDVIPDDNLMQVFELQFAMLRWIVQGATTQPTATSVSTESQQGP